MTANLPAILGNSHSLAIPPSAHENALLSEAASLYNDGYHPHALLNLWNASVANLRRRVEAYGVDLFTSVVKDEAGRKKYDKDGDTLADRWSGVDDLVLIAGASRLSLVNKKGGKALEMINWARNHASPAHDSDSPVGPNDVVAMALLLEANLFSLPMPDPGHSIAGLFDPVKNNILDQSAITLLTDQINSLKTSDVKNAFGFLLDLLCAGVAPSAHNATALMPPAWERASDELRKTAGLRYHAVRLDASLDTSHDKAMGSRLLNLLVAVGGVRYIPDATRAELYRHGAKLLAAAKDQSYGWGAEQTASQTLAQFGPFVPNIAFEEVYQEIISVYCGNYWGRSGAFQTLDPFIASLNSEQTRRLVQIIITNERARSELFQSKPKQYALLLLERLRSNLSIAAHLSEVDQAVIQVKAL